MGKIRVELKMEDFRLVKPNDSSGVDEPYLMTLYSRIDGWLNDPKVPAQDREIPIHFPSKMGQGDLGPKSDGMKFSGTTKVSVPAAIGTREMTLDTSNLDMLTSALQQCSAVLGVVFMEEDSSTNAQVKTVIEQAKKEVRRHSNFLVKVLLNTLPPIPAFVDPLTRQLIETAIATLRAKLLNSGFDPNGLISTELLDRIVSAAIPRIAGPLAAKLFIPGGEPWNWVLLGIQAGDRDEYIGADGVALPFFDFVGRAHAPTKFKFDTLRTHTFVDPITGEPWINPKTGKPFTSDNSDDGRYIIEGVAQRIDVDEVPTLALLRGPNDRVALLARRLDGNFFEMQTAEEFGKAFDVAVGKMGSRAFRSGPAAASAVDGSVQCVAGRINTDRFMFRLSRDAGSHFTAWKNVGGTKKFRGAPAVVLSTDGEKIYIVGRGEDDRYWYTSSANDGRRWSTWEACGTATFRTSPAAVCVRELVLGKPVKHILVVAGLRGDNRIWTTRFTDAGPAKNQSWKFIGTGPNNHPTAGFNSAPSMTANLKGQILLVCRASDMRYWRADSFDRGRHFLVGTTWARIGIPSDGPVAYTGTSKKRKGDLQAMFSAPAVVAREDMESMLMVGLSPTLGLWRNRSLRTNHQTWKPTLTEPESDARVHFY